MKKIGIEIEGEGKDRREDIYIEGNPPDIKEMIKVLMEEIITNGTGIEKEDIIEIIEEVLKEKE